MSRGSSLNGRPPAQRYSISAHRDSDRGYSGNHFCDAALVNPKKPLWPKATDRKTLYNTTIRILPGKDPDDPTRWDPYRISGKFGDYGDHIRAYPAWRGSGDPPITFFLYDVHRHKNYDDRDNPAMQLYFGISHLVKLGKENPGWAAMLKGDTGKAPVIGRPKRMHVVQCLLVEYGLGQDNQPIIYAPPKGLSPSERPILMDLGIDAGNKILNLWDTRTQDLSSVNTEDYYTGYQIYDPVGMEQGAFFTIFPVDFDPRKIAAQQQAAVQAPQRMTRESIAAPRQGGDKKDREIGFGVYAEPTFGGVSPDLSAFSDELAEKVCPWDEVLLFPSEQEQAELLWSCIRFDGKARPDVFEAAWSDHASWIPPKSHQVWAEFLGRTNVATGADYADTNGAARQEEEAPQAQPSPRIEPRVASPPMGGHRGRRLTPAEVPDRPDEDLEDVTPPVPTAGRGVARIAPPKPVAATLAVDEVDDTSEDTPAPFDPKATDLPGQQTFPIEPPPAPVRPPAAGPANIANTLAKMRAAKASIKK